MPKGFGQPTGNQRQGKTAREFFEKILQTTSYRKEDREKVYQLLDENQEKLTDAFADLIREQADLSLRRGSPKEKQKYAAKLHSFAMWIEAFPRGNRASNLEIAIACYEVLVKFFPRTTSPRLWAGLQNPLGACYGKRIRGDRADNLNSAVSRYQSALQVFTRETFPEEWATVQNNLGIIYSNQERFEEAIATFQSALKIRTRETFPEEWAMAQNNLGTIYIDQERFEEAIATFQSALKIRTRETFPKEWAGVQNNLGYAYRESGQSEVAVACLKLALEVRTREACPEEWAKIQYNLGSAYSDLERFETAISHFRASLEIFQPAAFPIDCLKAGRDFGKTAFKAGRWQEAIEGYRAAIEAVEVSCSWASSNQRRQEILEKAIDVYTQMVQACLHHGQSALAIEYVERSKARNLVQLFADADKPLQLMGEQSGAGQRKLLEKLKQQIIEKQRERDSLGEESGQQTSALRSKLDPAFMEALDGSALGEEPTITAAELDDTHTPNLNQLYARQVRAELEALQTQFDAALDELLESDPAYALTQAVRPIQFEEILEQIDEHTAIIEWYITDERFFAFVMSHHADQPEVWQSNAEDLTQLHQWQQTYLDDYRQHKHRQWAEQLPARLTDLARILHLPELLTKIPKACTQLILVPHRYLHLLPLHALPVDADQCLLDLFLDGVRYAPSCQLLQLSQKRATASQLATSELSRNLFAIQNPTDDLNFANVETEAIQSYFAEAHVLRNQQATKADWDRVKKQQQLSSATFIHFSCHSYFNFESPLKSALVLAGAKRPEAQEVTEIDPTRFLQSPERDTIDLSKCLLLEEIFSLNLRPCRLVTLSACETGLSNPRSLSDEYIGLPSGFLVAGSPSVVGSHWAVSDIATAFLMIKFYENLMEQIKQAPDASESSGQLSIAQALNQAQRWLRGVTESELRDWLKPLKLNQEQQKEIERDLKLSSSDRPFSNPLYWAAFGAIGQ